MCGELGKHFLNVPLSPGDCGRPCDVARTLQPAGREVFQPPVPTGPGQVCFKPSRLLHKIIPRTRTRLRRGARSRSRQESSRRKKVCWTEKRQEFYNSGTQTTKRTRGLRLRVRSSFPDVRNLLFFAERKISNQRDQSVSVTAKKSFPFCPRNIFSLTPALSRWEREPVRPRWVTSNAFGMTETECRSPSPSGRGPG